MSSEQFVELFVSGLYYGSIYALVGLGFTTIYSVTKIINFAQGEFVMLGGLLSFAIFSTYGVPHIPALILSILIATVIGALLYLLAIRSAKRASVVSLIIITIGAAIFIRGLTGQLIGKDFVRPPFFSGDNPIIFLGAHIPPQALWIIGTGVGLMVLLHLFFSYTMIGKALKACSISQTGASLMGINPMVMGLISFSLAAALGAVGGIVIAPLTTTFYGAGATLGLKGFVAASIGDFRSQVMTFMGGITLGIVESYAVAIDWGPFKAGYRDAISLMVLVLILLVRSRRLASE